MIFQVQEDHNYGEPGPSTLRHSRRIEQLSRTQRTPEEPEKSANVETPVDPLRIPETSTGRSLRTRTPRNNTLNDENESDPDDDKPLHLMAIESPTRHRPSRQSTRYSDEHVTQTPTGSSNTAISSTRSARSQKRPHYNEDSEEEDGHRSKRTASHGRYVFSLKSRKMNRITLLIYFHFQQHYMEQFRYW